MSVGWRVPSRSVSGLPRNTLVAAELVKSTAATVSSSGTSVTSGNAV